VRILSISTLHPSTIAPNFGRFVKLSLDAADAIAGIEIVRICPNGLPPWPLPRLLGKYRAQAGLPIKDGPIYRPRWTLLPGLAAPRNARAIAKALLPLARRLHAEKPFDVVDSQFFWPDSVTAMVVAEDLGLPFSAMARGSDIHRWTHVPGCREQIIETAQKATTILAVSAALKDDIAALGVDPAKIVVHLTGLDRSLFHVPHDSRNTLRGTLAIPTDGPLLVCVGTLMEHKGQNFVIEALPHLPETRLALFGEGPDRTKFEQLAKELGVAKRVHFMGSKPHAEVAHYLQAADVALLPSISEGLANVWIEALSCGTPLAITNVGGADQVLRDPECGRFIERDKASIIAAVQSLLADQRDRTTIAASVADYSWERNGALLVQHWQNMIAD
jgi:teichuronic acid biosynthesis glycosyltransferase TuaC